MTQSKTKLTTDAGEAAAVIRRGGIVAFPTETVYGLGANIFDETTVRRIFEAKRRPPDNPLIAHIYDKSQIAELAADVSENGRILIDAFFPGPLTVVLKKSPRVPLIATAGLDTVGIRMPRLPLAHEFLTACRTPVAAPSANISGRPSPTTWQAVLEDLDGRIDCILQGDAAQIGLESTVVDCTDNVPVILRSGSLSVETLSEVVPAVTIADMSTRSLGRSPGTRHRHYSPHAVVRLIGPKSEIQFAESASASPSDLKFGRRHIAYIGLAPPPFDEFALVRLVKSIDEYAHQLFEFFRECDRQGIDEIYCETVVKVSIGTALMDRLERAAED